MPPNVFFQGIVPIMGVNKSVVIGISTESDKPITNYYSRLMTKTMIDRATGKKRPIFHTIRFGMACAACMAAGTSRTCDHKSSYRAPWKSDERQYLLEVMYGEARKADMRRETMGLAVGDETRCFTPESVEFFENRDPLPTVSSVDVIFLTIDPSAGGHSSEFAVISFHFNGANLVINGVSTSDAVTMSEIMTCYRSHVLALRSKPQYKHSKIIVICESDNNAVLSSCFEECTKSTLSQPSTPMEFLNTDAKRTGVWTRGHKELYVHSLSNHLKMHAVAWSQTDIYGKNDKLRQEQKRKLVAQLEAFIITHDPNTNKREFSGKTSGPDDVAMCLMMGLHWAQYTVAQTRMCQGLLVM